MSVIDRSFKNKYQIDLLCNDGVLSNRTWNSLKKFSDVEYLTDFESMSIREVKKIKGIGPKSYMKLKRLCNDRGIFFEDDVDNYPVNAINAIIFDAYDHSKIIPKPGYTDRFFEVLNILDDRIKYVMEAHYKDGLSYEDISENTVHTSYAYPENKLSKERIRQLHSRSLRKLRHPIPLIYILFGERLGYFAKKKE